MGILDKNNTASLINSLFFSTLILTKIFQLKYISNIALSLSFSFNGFEISNQFTTTCLFWNATAIDPVSILLKVDSSLKCNLIGK